MGYLILPNNSFDRVSPVEAPCRQDGTLGLNIILTSDDSQRAYDFQKLEKGQQWVTMTESVLL